MHHASKYSSKSPNTSRNANALKNPDAQKKRGRPNVYPKCKKHNKVVFQWADGTPTVAEKQKYNNTNRGAGGRQSATPAPQTRKRKHEARAGGSQYSEPVPQSKKQRIEDEAGGSQSSEEAAPKSPPEVLSTIRRFELETSQEFLDTISMPSFDAAMEALNASQKTPDDYEADDSVEEEEKCEDPEFARVTYEDYEKSKSEEDFSPPIPGPLDPVISQLFEELNRDFMLAFRASLGIGPNDPIFGKTATTVNASDVLPG